MAKILTARQAVDTYFYDGATVTFGGFANGLMHPEEIMVALEEAARSSGHPRGLRVVYASGQGDSGERGLNHLAVDGMCTTVIGGHSVSYTHLNLICGFSYGSITTPRST